jgi:hypothetical protein
MEYVPTMARHSGTASAMILRRTSLRAAGLSLENGDDALKGEVFTCELYDKRDPGMILRKYSGVSCASSNVTIQKHQIVMSNVQLVALDATGNTI